MAASLRTGFPCPPLRFPPRRAQHGGGLIPEHLLTHVLAGAAVLLLLAVAWSDLATRTIPNRLSLAIAAIAIPGQIAGGPAAFAVSAGSAALLFAALVVPFSFGVLGGGDVKLAPALALGFSPSGVWDFVVLTALAGGALGLAYIALSHLLPPARGRIQADAPLLQRVMAVERRRIRRRAGLPYGIAIAAGGVAMLVPKLLHGVP